MRASRIAAVTGAAVSALWLLYALSLDVRYRRFPEVLLGAVQILLAFYVVVGIVALAWRGARRVAGLATRGRRGARR